MNHVIKVKTIYATNGGNLVEANANAESTCPNSDLDHFSSAVVE